MKIINKRYTRAISIIAGFLLSTVIVIVAGAAEFPHRAEFPDLKTIEMQDLAAKHSEYLIIDVRSEFEYDIAHILDAHNAPMANMLFVKTVARLQERFGHEAPLVVYCNGISCRKSYEAAAMLIKENIKNVVVYDEGMDAWLHKYPALSVLVGKPATLDRIIRDDQFNKHVLDATAFTARLRAEKNPLVIDVRDPIQRTVSLPEDARQFQLDKFSRVLQRNQFKDRPLFIVDAVGKQVRWLQYLLEDKGYQNYFFLKDGADAFKK